MVKTIKRNNSSRLPSSYRDPSGYLFKQEDKLFRSISFSYEEHYKHLVSSGLYLTLVNDGLLIPHTEQSLRGFSNTEKKLFKVIQPDVVPFVSYPYEWSFSMLKDAALCTLTIARAALSKGMILKDATPYNIQFYNGKPILIDTLSFEVYREGYPWVAYRQFCEMFLAPLALASYVDERLLDLLRVYIDGIPLDLVKKLLPTKSRFSLSLLVHIFLHARSQSTSVQNFPRAQNTKQSLSKVGLLGIIDNLESAVSSLSLRSHSSIWSDYYDNTNYSDEGMNNKKKLVETILKDLRPKVTWDIGANTGEFSLISAKTGAYTLSLDYDYLVIEKLYRNIRKDNISNILPLRFDLTNPSSSLGFANQERSTLSERGHADVILALALIHHIAIAKNVPFDLIAQYFSTLTTFLVIEFVPKEDSQVIKLLSQREDVFVDYNQKNFELSFSKFFIIKKKVSIEDTKRTLYVMQIR